MRLILSIIFLAICGFAHSSGTDSLYTWPDRKLKVVVFDIKEEIAPSVTRLTNKAFAKAVEINADLVIIHMNTYGGLLNDADSIRTKILNSPIPVFVFVDNNAASAGALISISCNKIYMRKGGNIGAATVVDQSGAAAPDKYQSYMRSMMRSTAEARGRNQDIAQGMVDGKIVVDSVNKEGQVITLTTSEAIKWGFCEGEVNSIVEILKNNKVENFETIEVHKSTLDKVIGFLMNPAVSGILILIILGGIYFELQTPGVGFPILAAGIAAMLYFAPLYLEGLAANWEILLFFVGIILLALEIFVIPGFGIAGISGISLILGSLLLAMVRNINFDFSLTGGGEILSALLIVSLASIGFIILMFFGGPGLLNSPLFKRIILTETLAGAHVHMEENESDTIIGKSGVCYTDIRPMGKVMVDGILFEAKSIGKFIDKGTNVEIVKKEGFYWIVKPV